MLVWLEESYGRNLDMTARSDAELAELLVALNYTGKTYDREKAIEYIRDKCPVLFVSERLRHNRAALNAAVVAMRDLHYASASPISSILVEAGTDQEMPNALYQLLTWADLIGDNMVGLLTYMENEAKKDGAVSAVKKEEAKVELTADDLGPFACRFSDPVAGYVAPEPTSGARECMRGDLVGAMARSLADNPRSMATWDVCTLHCVATAPANEQGLVAALGDKVEEVQTVCRLMRDAKLAEKKRLAQK